MFRNNHKTLLFVIGVALLLAGCSNLTGEHIQVSTREYVGGIAGLDYYSWNNDKFPVQKGISILSDNQYKISASISSIRADNIVIQFSNPVYVTGTEQYTDIITIEKNKTYVFIAGGGTSGLEIKVRYN